MLTFWIRDLILISEKANTELLVNQDKIMILEDIVEKMSTIQFYRCFKEVEKRKTSDTRASKPERKHGVIGDRSTGG